MSAGIIFFHNGNRTGQSPAYYAALEAETLVPVGHTIGIKLFAEGVIVIGLAEVESESGVSTPGVDCGLQVGDVIEEANGQKRKSPTSRQKSKHHRQKSVVFVKNL